MSQLKYHETPNEVYEFIFSRNCQFIQDTGNQK